MQISVALFICMMIAAEPTQPSVVSKVTPQPGEPYDQFVVRAHGQLMTAIPEPMERNQAVWDAWSAQYGDPERDRADQYFATDRFVKRPDVCYFSEHEAPSRGPDGQPTVRRYDVGALTDIMRENNHRIEDCDAYPTLIDGHTSPKRPNEPIPAQPSTLGGVGPFRLGMIGRKEPRFALFADEYGRRDAENVLSGRPGRSVEVLTLRSNGRTYINPIAAISEAPRLPLPLQFSVSEEGEQIERYSMLAPTPASPAGSNTFTQKFDAAGGNGQPAGPPTQQGSGMIGDEDARKIVDAVMSVLPEMVQQAVQQAMAAGGAAGPQPGGQPDGGAPPQPPSPQPPQQQQESYMGTPAPMRRYSADDAETDYGNEELQERYAALAESQAELINELADTRNRLLAVEQQRTDAERREQIRELYSAFPHAVDLDREFSRCLYSAGAAMDDQQFSQHLEDIQHYAAKAVPSSPMVPRGTMPAVAATEADTVRYAAQESEEIRRLTNEYANQGVTKTWHELKAEAHKNLQGAA